MVCAGNGFGIAISVVGIVIWILSTAVRFLKKSIATPGLQFVWRLVVICSG